MLICYFVQGHGTPEHITRVCIWQHRRCGRRQLRGGRGRSKRSGQIGERDRDPPQDDSTAVQSEAVREVGPGCSARLRGTRAGPRSGGMHSADGKQKHRGLPQAVKRFGRPTRRVVVSYYA